MSQHKRTKRRFPMTAILAVLLILAGAATIAGSLWMQENEINTGAELYENLSEQLKLPPATEDNPATQQDEAPAEDNAAAEDDSAEQDELEQEQPVVVIPEELSAEESPVQPDVTVVPPLALQPVEQPAYQFDPTPEGNSGVTSGLTGANLAACKEANSDFAAWLKIPGTDIDYPVVRTNDVDYYLDHTFTGEESIVGCLFSLGRTDYDAPSQNIAIYGHHMRRSRSTTMFQPLHEYKSASFRDAHATIHLDTLNGSRSYTVFAVISKRESDWDASAADFSSQDEYQAFLDRALEWSLYDTGVSVTKNDHILTLITCDRDYNSEDGQLVVMAVQN